MSQADIANSIIILP